MYSFIIPTRSKYCLILYEIICEVLATQFGLMLWKLGSPFCNMKNSLEEDKTIAHQINQKSYFSVSAVE